MRRLLLGTSTTATFFKFKIKYTIQKNIVC